MVGLSVVAVVVGGFWLNCVDLGGGVVDWILLNCVVLGGGLADCIVLDMMFWYCCNLICGMSFSVKQIGSTSATHLATARIHIF